MQALQLLDVVTSDDGEYLQNDGTTIVVKDGKIAEIKPAEKKDEPAYRDWETDRKSVV